MYFHKGCGGKVVKGVCLKCKKDWGRFKFWVAKDIEYKDGMGFSADRVRKRIRDGKDISTERFK